MALPNTLLEAIRALTPLETAGFASGLLYVLLAARESAWCWAAGLVNVAAFFAISYKAQLYSDMGLQVLYLALTLYGTYMWLFGGSKQKNEQLHISKTNRKTWTALLLLSLLGTLLMGYLLNHHTDTDVPYWDALTTALSIAATWMTARKKLENWLIWIFVDPIYVGLYFYKGWYLSSLLFVIYTLIAIAGYFAWKRTYRQQKNA